MRKLTFVLFVRTVHTLNFWRARNYLVSYLPTLKYDFSPAKTELVDSLLKTKRFPHDTDDTTIVHKMTPIKLGKVMSHRSQKDTRDHFSPAPPLVRDWPIPITTVPEIGPGWAQRYRKDSRSSIPFLIIYNDHTQVVLFLIYYQSVNFFTSFRYFAIPRCETPATSIPPVNLTHESVVSLDPIAMI